MKNRIFSQQPGSDSQADPNTKSRRRKFKKTIFGIELTRDELEQLRALSHCSGMNLRLCLANQIYHVRKELEALLGFSGEQALKIPLDKRREIGARQMRLLHVATKCSRSERN